MLNIFRHSWTRKLILISIVFILLQASFISGMGDLGLEESTINLNPHQRQGSTIKEITFYLHNSTNARYIFDYSSTHILNTSLGNKTNTIWDQQRVRMNWFLHPTLAGDFHVNGKISMVLYINTKGVSANANLYVDIYEVTYKDAGSETSNKIYSGTDSSIITSGIDSYQIDIDDLEHTFSSGSSIRIYYEIQGGASAEFGLWYGNSSFDSRITFQAYDYLKVSEVGTYDHLDSPKTNFEIDASNKTVKMHANITDPFGGYDINMVKLTLRDPLNDIILNNITMLKIAGTPISYSNLYEVLWNYTNAQIGQYHITVWAVDNNGYYHYYHQENFNFGNHADVGTGSFFIGGLPRVGHIKVLDKGAPQKPIEGALVNILKGDIILFSNTTNSTGQVGINTFQGTYDIIVEWQDVIVGQQLNFNVDSNFNLTLECDVFYPQFKVVDNNNHALEGANIYIGHPNNTFLIRPFTTDENGLIFIDKAPVGNYNLIVKWRDVEVADEIHLVNKNGLIATIVAKVFEVKLKFIDSHNISLPGAQVIFADSVSRLILDSKLSDVGGEITSQLPAGNYNITVYWEQRVIQQFELGITDDLSQTISCWVYYINFLITDPAPHNAAVENARVLFTAPESGGLFDSQLTGPDGRVETRLPEGLVNIKVYWKSSSVNSTQIKIDDDVPISESIKLICSIYYITLQAVDSRDNTIENTQITVSYTSTGEVVDTQITNTNGQIVSRLPKDNFDISARWFDTIVYEETNKLISSDMVYELECWVYYLELRTVDSKNITLLDALVSISMVSEKKVISSGTVGVNGTYNARLPTGGYEIDVKWEGVLVKEEEVQNLQADRTLLLKCNVFYITVTAIDVQTLPLENAQITLSFTEGQKVYDSDVTGVSGSMESRMPIGDYDIEVIWKGVVVYTESAFALDSNKQYTVNCKVYYLSIKVVGNDGIALKDVSITVKDPIEQTVENLYTDKSGKVEFRLPKNNYYVIARLQTTYYYKEIDQKEKTMVDLSNNSADLKIKFDAFPPAFTDTPLFGMIVSVVLFIIILLLLWLLVIRKLKHKLNEQKYKKEETSAESIKEEPKSEIVSDFDDKVSRDDIEITPVVGEQSNGLLTDTEDKTRDNDISEHDAGVEPELEAEMEEMEKMNLED